MKRRAFLCKSGIIAGATLLGCRPTVRDTGAETTAFVTFDLHTHPGAFPRKGTPAYGGDEGFLSRVEDMKTQGLNGAFFSLVTDLPLLIVTETGIETEGTYQGDEGWNVFLGQLTVLQDLLKRADVEIALGAGELHPGEAVKAYIACEGGDFLGGRLERVEEAYDLGVRSIQLVH